MYFSKQSVKKKQGKLQGKTQKYERRGLVSGFKMVLVAILFVIVVLAGAGFGMFKGILDDAPDISTINIKPKGFKSVIYDQDGHEKLSLSTANSNRIYVYYDEISQPAKDAFVAIEDERFWTHNGIDIRGIGRAFYEDVKNRNTHQGASTITQQLIKNQVFNVGLNETTLDSIERKVQEQYLAIELEKIYSKEQILEYYLNTIYLGQGVNGVEAAAQMYFDKSAKDLTVSEASVIASITQNPYSYNPVLYPEKNVKRRTKCLDKMVELGFITEAEAKAAKEDTIYDTIKRVHENKEETKKVINSYYDDALLRALAGDFMEMYDMTKEEAFNEVYTGGYSIYSVQDDDMQKIADTVLNDPQYYPKTSLMLDYQLTLVDNDGKNVNYGTHHVLTYFHEQGDTKFDEYFATEQEARDAATKFRDAMIQQTGYKYLDENFKCTYQPQSSMTIIDQSTGYIKAIVGGRGEKTDNLGFCRATRAMRQPGSCFKTLAAFLPYIDTGGCLACGFTDEPYKYANGRDVKNWYSGYRGYGSIREAIKNSMNIVAVKSITEVTPEVSFDYLQKLGFTTLVDKQVTSDGLVLSDINQAMALGGLTNGVTNLEITAAYAAIANNGVYIKPVYYSKVVDHDGNTVIDNTTTGGREKRVIRATTAYQLTDAMKDVISSGTGTPARLKGTNMPVAGKTGTTTHNYDLWFCGYTPYLTCSIWRGFDSPENMGSINTHKEMWSQVMSQIIELKQYDTSKNWEVPEGLVKTNICKISNLKPGSGCQTNYDWCDKDFIPSKACSGHITLRICLDSYECATENCENVGSFLVEYDENGNFVLVGATFPYDSSIMNTTCHLHPESAGYKISTSAGEGGSITPTTEIKEGESFTVNITPNAGYSISVVYVDGTDVGAVSSFTFNEVSMDHTISATFVANGQQPAPPPPPTEQPTEAPTEAPTDAPTDPPPEGN